MARRHTWINRVLTVVVGVVICFVSSGSPALASVANPQLTLRSSVGFQSYYNPQTWVPVRITVVNRGKRPVAGDLIFSVTHHAPFGGLLRWPLTVGPQSTVKTTIAMPGNMLNQHAVMSFVVSGVTQALTRLAGVSTLGASPTGMVSATPQAVQSLAGVTIGNGAVQMVTAYLTPSQIPAHSMMLESLSNLYLDGEAASALSVSQVHAILDWVKAGGVLILGGVQPNAGQTLPFQNVSPVTPQVVIDSKGAALSAFAGAPPVTGLLPELLGVSTRGSHVIIGDAKHALVADRMYGRGIIAYVGLNPISPLLLSWSGNTMFYTALFEAFHTQLARARFDLFGAGGTWSLVTAAEQFPQLNAPPLWLWATIFLLYLFVAGPGLFILLRRNRKHERAWWILPILSVVVAGSIYEYGVLVRPNGILTQSVGLIDIVDPHLAEATGVEALMSPQTRAYSVSTPPGTYAVPLSESDVLPKQTMTTYLPSGSLLNFSQVRAWSGRYAFVAGVMRHFGAFSATLQYTKKEVYGTVTNQTATSYTDLALVLHGKVVMLGALRAGHSTHVQAVLASSTKVPFALQLANALPSSSSGVGHSIFEFVNELASPSLPSQAILIGWAHAEPKLFYPDGAVLSASPQWVVRQLVDVTKVAE